MRRLTVSAAIAAAAALHSLASERPRFIDAPKPKPRKDRDRSLNKAQRKAAKKARQAAKIEGQRPQEGKDAA